MIGFLRKNFPATVSSETVKKFGLASNNESYVINALQFIGAIDEEGKRTEKGHDVFVLGDDDFPSAFEGLVKEAYSDLFELRGDDAWSLSKKDLTSYFRSTDKTSEAIGSRQAAVFVTFRALAGHEQSSDKPAPRATKTAPRATKTAPSAKAKPAAAKKTTGAEVKTATKATEKANTNDQRRDMALTVRDEINLPANGTKETYDAIFKSIKANLIDD